MAKVTITFEDSNENPDAVHIQIVSDPPFDVQNNEGTTAQHLGVQVMEILNEQLDKMSAKSVDDGCCHGSCGCHHDHDHDHDHDEYPVNAVAPQVNRARKHTVSQESIDSDNDNA